MPKTKRSQDRYDGNGNGHTYSHDDDGSSLSSAFSEPGDGTGAGGWSVPRTRPNQHTHQPSRNAGPRRSGSSFRVSLKPSRRHRRRQHDDLYRDEQETVWSVLVGWVDCVGHRRPARKIVKQGLCVLMGLAIIVTMHEVMMGPVPFDNVPNDLPSATDHAMMSAKAEAVSTASSTEDLVAQGEMAAITSEELLHVQAVRTDEEKREDFYQGVFNKDKTQSFDQNNNNWDPQNKQTMASLRGSKAEDPASEVPVSGTTTTATTTATTSTASSSTASTKDATIKAQKGSDNNFEEKQSSSTGPDGNGQLPTEQKEEQQTVTAVEAAEPQEPKRTDWGPSRQSKKPFNMVAYVLPIFTCYSDLELQRKLVLKAFNEPSSDKELHDAALMLQASIHQNSIRTPASNSSYDYEMVALIHRSVENCPGGTNRTAMLENLGYRVEVVREPIHPTNIQNEYLKNHATRNMGQRVGVKEMIRLFAFKLEEYPLTVLVDTLSWVMRPADAIFDMMLNGPNQWSKENPNHFVMDTFYSNGTIAKQPRLPQEIDIMFSRDYAALKNNDWNTGMSLQFLPIKPNVRTFNRLINTYQTVPYDATHGWDSKGYANYGGSMLTKGLLTYYFSERQTENKVELHRCIYNNMADIPFIAGKNGAGDSCRDVKEHQLLPDGSPMPCTDCRSQPWDEIVAVNFGTCHVPWICPYTKDMPKLALLGPTLQMCRKFHASWFGMRKAIEETFLAEDERIKAKGTFHPEIFHGYCLPGGKMDGGMYTPMKRASFPNGLESHMIDANGGQVDSEVPAAAETINAQ